MIKTNPLCRFGTCLKNKQPRFREREMEFELKMVKYNSLDDEKTPSAAAPSETNHDSNGCTDGGDGGSEKEQLGMLCTCSTDAAFVERWGQAHFDELYRANGLRTIWDWSPDSGLRPCACSLRHCALGAEKLGPVAYASFLDETVLCDRKTTIRSYLERHPEVLTTLPPEQSGLRERYSG